MFWEVLLLILILGYLFRGLIFGVRPKTYPPGPIRFPIVGNLPLLGNNPLQTLSKWKETYGDIIGLRFGDFNVVVLHGHDIIKEAYDRPEFSGRPSLGPLILIAGKEKRGLVAAEGPHWSEQRRFALRHLRDFGFGKKSMEGGIQEDVSEFVATLKKNEGNPLTTDRMLSLLVVSSLWNIMVGEKLPIDDSRTTELLNTLNALLSTTSISGPAFFMSWIAKIAPKLTGWSHFETAIINIKSFMRGKIDNHKSLREPNNPRDFMDVYLDEIEKTKDTSSSFYGRAGDENMLVAMLNLFGAGAEPTANTLNWSFFLLAENQKVQKKLHEELDKVVGRNRLPCLEDQEKLVYTKAVMQEVFRKSSITPFGVFHSMMETVTFHGFEIPKNTAIMSNLYDVHHDAKTWGDPEIFRPERFLNPDKTQFIKTGHVIPFLIGKRACLGETLARANFYLILTGVLQRFDIRLDPNTEITDNTIPSLFRFPPKNKLIFTDRYD